MAVKGAWFSTAVRPSASLPGISHGIRSGWITETVEFISPVGIESEDSFHTADAYGPQYLMGLVVNAYFLEMPFFVGGNEPLQKFGEPDDVNQFVGDNVEAEWEQLQSRG